MGTGSRAQRMSDAMMKLTKLLSSHAKQCLAWGLLADADHVIRAAEVVD